MASYSDMRFVDEERQKFRRCSSKLLSLVPISGGEHRQELNSVLDELNSLDYSISDLVDKVNPKLVCYGVQNLEALSRVVQSSAASATAMTAPCSYSSIVEKSLSDCAFTFESKIIVTNTEHEEICTCIRLLKVDLSCHIS